MTNTSYYQQLTNIELTINLKFKKKQNKSNKNLKFFSLKCSRHNDAKAQESNGIIKA